MSRLPRLRILALSLVTASLFFTARPAFAQSSADVVLEWNRILITALNVPGANPPTTFVTRPMTMTQIAVFEALNAIDPRYASYVAVPVNPPAGASRDVAAAQAAHDVLVALMPSQTATFDAALAAAKARTDATSAAGGATVGAAAAKAILDLRANDGWNRPPDPYLLPALPGYWQPTPTANSPATFVQYQNVMPFAIPNAQAMMVEAPPAITSSRYAADFNEVKAIGAVNSTTRTAEQTVIANAWAAAGNSTNPVAAWNVGMQDVTRSQNLNALDAARMFALTNMALHDGLFMTFSGKFLYGLWRPVTAIREAARDNNPATEADPNWLPLIQTPPYPSYPGNNACIGAAAASSLGKVLGRDNIPFTITWTGTTGPTVVRNYNGFRQAADEEERARIYGGIHYTFDNLAAIGACNSIGDYAATNYLRKR